MQTSEFEQWCDRLQLKTPTCDFLLRLRSSPPARRVQARLLNVSGNYASCNMGVSIQFESHTVELWAIYMKEYDEEVLEYFDKPCTIELHYQSPSSRPTQAHHTPDFLVIRRDGAYFEGWKPENKVLEMIVTHPGRYQRDEQGNWGCPPGEETAACLGFTYGIRSSAELHATYIRNLIFLEDYFFECAVSCEALALILETVEAEPRISLAAMREQHPHLRVDPVYALISHNRLYVDLHTELLKEHQHLHLYLDRPSAEAHVLTLASQGSAPFGRIGIHTPGANLTTLHANTPLFWDGRQWTLLNLGDMTTTLLLEVGTLVQMETSLFLHLVETQAITVLEPTPGEAPTLSTEVHHLLTQAEPEALDIAKQRYRLMEAYRNKQKEDYKGISPRTIRDWQASFRDAEVRYGCGYVGLLPRTAARGNRTPKAPEAPRRLLEETIEQFNTSSHVVAGTPVNVYQVKGAMIDYLLEHAVPSSILRPTFEMENFSGPWMKPDIIGQGRVAYPLPTDFKASWICADDSAALSIATLNLPDLAGSAFEFSGSQALDGSAIAQHFTDLLDRQVHYVAISTNDYEQALAQAFGRTVAFAIAEQFRWRVEQPNAAVEMSATAEFFSVELTPLARRIEKQDWSIPALSRLTIACDVMRICTISIIHGLSNRYQIH